MDKVLLLDTNVASAPIHQFLAGAGFEVHVVGRNPNDFLAKSADRYVNLDYSDVDATLSLAERIGAKHIVPGCNDLSYRTCAAIGARRPLAGVDTVAASDTLLNKPAFRRYAAERGLPAPRAVAEADWGSGRPLIVKPADAYSGRGVTAMKAPSRQEVEAAVATAKGFSASGSCVVEELVEGQLYSHTAFIDRGEVVADFIVEEHGRINPFTVDTSRVIFDFDPGMLGSVRAAIGQIAHDLNLRPGLVHTQFIADGARFWIIEITRRCPGDLYSQLIALSTGFNYAENYARPFIGQPFEGRGSGPAYVLRHTIAVAEAQTFGSLQFHRPINMAAFVPLALAGDRVEAAPFGRVGILFARTQGAEALDELMRAVLAGALYSVRA